MTDKNPYEKQDSIEIPQFSNKKDDSIDISLFKTNEEVEESEFDDDDYEDYEESGNKKIWIIVGAVIGLILVVGIIFSIIFATNKAKEYDAIYNEYQAYVTQSTKKEADYKQSISDLQKEVEELKAELEGQKQQNKNGTEYRCTQEDNVNVRKEASTTSEKVGLVTYNEIVVVYETKIQSGYTWGRIDSGWVVIKDNAGNSWFEVK